MKDKKETRGGLRWNSATLYQSRKPLDHICTWCNDSFTSTGNKEKRMTKRMRKRHTFRPEVWRA